MPSDRFRRVFPGLSAAEQQEVRPALLGVAGALRVWRRQFRPGDPRFWAIDRAQQALNELARSLTGEPLWAPADNHGGGFPGHERPDPPSE